MNIEQKDPPLRQPTRRKGGSSSIIIYNRYGLIFSLAQHPSGFVTVHCVYPYISFPIHAHCDLHVMTDMKRGPYAANTVARYSLQFLVVVTGLFVTGRHPFHSLVTTTSSIPCQLLKTLGFLHCKTTIINHGRHAPYRMHALAHMSRTIYSTRRNMRKLVIRV